ncbi:MAG: 30S ribosomal protein S16 [Candidatus Omnitrophica bacterium CG11_big_fil_rev_8_21_14_0_20_42_13]|uniref:Small ribosomal subunit protein bS16 n=1 Tax=Candidatus Ghiorseimicrobium undicola TaxID=1974746 RepID=A0A2H0LXJ7_9BACT|nr:MAG: 30S ribosomal protein S16 [Candidatus Omnitrophica bacterium CG11_big_fil_rev_8_21_14_0_20_42_13]
MAVVIRLARPGKSAKKRLFFRVHVIDSAKSRDSRVIEQVGIYDPMKNPKVVSLKKDRIEYWVSKGAKLSPTVKSLVKKYK